MPVGQVFFDQKTFNRHCDPMSAAFDNFRNETFGVTTLNPNMAKIQYVIIPNVAKIPRNISNPDGLSSPLLYFLAIKTNTSILLLAYP
jgi:hypothetical protein